MSKDNDYDASVDVEIDLFRDLTVAAKDRLLRKALMVDANRRKPLHRRDPEADDPASDEQDMERERTVDLHQNKGKPAPIPVTDEDFPEEVADELPKAKKGKKS
jgi:hypothetical protein